MLVSFIGRGKSGNEFSDHIHGNIYRHEVLSTIDIHMYNSFSMHYTVWGFLHSTNRKQGKIPCKLCSGALHTYLAGVWSKLYPHFTFHI